MSSAQKADTVDRERQVMELAIAGYDFRAIGEHVGMSSSGAFKAFNRALDKTIRPATDAYRALHLSRLETIFRTHYPAMRKGDMAATDRCLRTLTDIAKLMGLDAPSKINIDVMVKSAAEQLGLSDDERARLHADVEAFIAEQKAGVG